MKSFKTILSEVAKDARNDEDKRFKDQHIVQKFDYPVEGSDAIFKGTIDKKPRLADDGSDANYDQAYAKKQTRGKALGEDADLVEISMDLAKKAFYKRKSQAFDAAHRGDREAANKLANKKNKIKAYIQAREEVEQLGEAKLDAFDFEPMDPPKGIDYDDKNLRKVNWKLYDDGAIRDIIKMADTSANERSPHGPNFQATAGRYYLNIIKAAKAELKKRGIKEDVDITELHMSLLEAHGIEKKVAERVKKVFDAMSDADKAAFMKAYLKNPKAATEYMFKDMKKMAEGVDTSDEKKLDEVLDDPKSMDRYRSKAKMSSDRAKNSATANRLRGTDDSKDMKTIDKREKGLKMVDRNAARKFRKEEVELDEAEMSLYDKIKAARANPSPDKP